HPANAACKNHAFCRRTTEPGSARTFSHQLKKSVEAVYVIDDPPMTTALFYFLPPVIQPRHVLARIEVIRAQLGHIQRNDVKALQVQRNVPDVALGQVLLHVREDENLLVARVLLLQELDG